MTKQLFWFTYGIILLVPNPIQTTNSSLKKPSQAIYVPPQRKSSSKPTVGAKDEQASDKEKPRIESGIKVVTPIKKKSSRSEMRKFIL